MYSATWTDGQIKKWSHLSNSWRRNGSTTIALKVLNNSENVSEDFLNEVKKNLKSKISYAFYNIYFYYLYIVDKINSLTKLVVMCV